MTLDQVGFPSAPRSLQPSLRPPQNKAETFRREACSVKVRTLQDPELRGSLLPGFGQRSAAPRTAQSLRQCIKGSPTSCAQAINLQSEQACTQLGQRLHSASFSSCCLASIHPGLWPATSQQQCTPGRLPPWPFRVWSLCRWQRRGALPGTVPPRRQ